MPSGECSHSFLCHAFLPLSLHFFFMLREEWASNAIYYYNYNWHLEQANSLSEFRSSNYSYSKKPFLIKKKKRSLLIISLCPNSSFCKSILKRSWLNTRNFILVKPTCMKNFGQFLGCIRTFRLFWLMFELDQVWVT